MVDVERVVRIYKNRIRKNELMKALAENAADFRDVARYAAGSVDELTAAVTAAGDIAALPESELTELLDAGLRASHGDVTRICRRVQRKINDRARLGIGILTPEYDRQAAADVAQALAETATTSDALSAQLKKAVLGVVDESIKRNFEAAGEIGLNVRITRRYDNIGLRSGTKHAEDCQWCLAREGTWDNVDEAEAAGAFERHPGCGCVITYEVGKTRTWSNAAGKWTDL